MAHSNLWRRLFTRDTKRNSGSYALAVWTNDWNPRCQSSWYVRVWITIDSWFPEAAIYHLIILSMSHSRMQTETVRGISDLASAIKYRQLEATPDKYDGGIEVIRRFIFVSQWQIHAQAIYTSNWLITKALSNQKHGKYLPSDFHSSECTDFPV